MKFIGVLFLVSTFYQSYEIDMVQLLDTQGDFLSLILKAEKPQRRAILDTLSHDQLDFLGEIFHNLIHNFPIPQSEKKKLQKKQYIKLLTNLKKSHRIRIKAVKKNKKHIDETLIKYRNKLIKLVS